MGAVKNLKPKKAKIEQVESVAPAAAAPEVEAPAEDEQPNNERMATFGDLGLYA